MRRGYENCCLGYYSPPDGQAQQCRPWSSCPLGSQVVEEGTATQDVRCAPCPAGHVGDGTNCFSCLPGAYMPAGSAGACADYACAAGFTDHDGNSSTPCVACARGCRAGTEEMVACTPTSDRRCRRCAAGLFSPDGLACRACRPPCSNGSFALSLCDGISDYTCRACTPATHCSFGVEQACAPTADTLCRTSASGSKGGDTSVSVPWWAFLLIALVAVLLLTNGYWLGRHCKAKQRRHDHTLALGLELERLSRRGPYSYAPSQASSYARYPPINGYHGQEGAGQPRGADVVLPGESRLSSRHPSEYGYGTKQHLYERINPLGIRLPYDQQGSLMSLDSSTGPYLGPADSSSTDPDTPVRASTGHSYAPSSSGYGSRGVWASEEDVAAATAAAAAAASAAAGQAYGYGDPRSVDDGASRDRSRSQTPSSTSSRWRRLFRRRSTSETPSPPAGSGPYIDSAGPRVGSWLGQQGAAAGEARGGAAVPAHASSSPPPPAPPPLPPRARAYSTDGRRGTMYLPDVAARPATSESAKAPAAAQDQPGIYSATDGGYLQPRLSQEKLGLSLAAALDPGEEYMDVAQTRQLQRGSATPPGQHGPPQSPSKWSSAEAAEPTQAMLALVRRTGLAGSRSSAHTGTSRSLGDLSRDLGSRAAGGDGGDAVPRAVEGTDGGSAPVESQAEPAIVVKDTGDGYEKMSPARRDNRAVPAGLDIPPAPLVGKGHMYERLEGGKLPRTRSINFSAATLQNNDSDGGSGSGSAATDDDPEDFYSLLGSEAVGGGEITDEARSLFRLGQDVNAAADRLASAVDGAGKGKAMAAQRSASQSEGLSPSPAAGASSAAEVADDDDAPHSDPFRRAIKHRSSGKSVSSAIHWASDFVSQFVSNNDGSEAADAPPDPPRQQFRDSV